MVFTVFAHEDFKIGLWNDVSCDNRRPYICEKKPGNNNFNEVAA